VFAFATSDWVGFIWLAVTCGCLVLFVIFDLLDYLLNQMYVGERELMISRGKFAKSVLCIPYEKIQYLTYIQGPVEHLLGVSRARVNILASTMSQKQMVGAFPVEDYERLHEKLEQSYMSQEKTLG
jgi:membrane protein YdbS with pleckstrin-like domain